jgi:hypothetical protein
MMATLVLIAGLSLVSCSGLRVYVGKTVPAEFTFGAGRFAECCTDFDTFAVFEEGSKMPLWRIVASKQIVGKSEADSLSILYGKVPDRFQQATPASGEPAPLVEGKQYLAIAGSASYVPWARVQFIIKDNQIVSLPTQPHDNP